MLQGSTPASSPEAAAQCFQAQAEAAATWLQRQQQLDIFGAVSSPVSDSQSATSLNAAGTSASSAGTLQKLQASTHAISSIAAAASKQMLQSDPDPTCAQSNKLESIAPTAAAIPDVNAPSEAVAQGCMVTPPALQQSQSSADSGAREPSLLQPDSNSQEVPVDRHYLLVTCTSPMQQAQQQAELQEVASCMSLATVDSASLATTQQANQPPEQLREQNQLEAQLLAIQASSTENDMLRSTQANAAAGQSAEQCTPCGREQMAGKGASPALKQFALTVQQHQPQAEQPRQPQAEQQHQPQTEQRHQSQAEPQHEPQAEQQPQVQQHQQLRDKPIEQQVQAKAEPQVEQQPHWTEEQQQTHGEAQQQQSPQAQQQQQQLNEVQTEEKLQVQAEAEAEQQKQPQTELEGKQQLEPETEPCSEEQQQQPQAEPCAEQQHQPQSEQQQQPQVQQQQQPWDEPQAELRQQPQDERSQQPQAEQQQHPQAQQQHQPQAELQAEQFQPESESAAEQQKQPQVKLTAEQQLKLQTEPCIEQQQQPQAELEQQEPQAQRQHQSQPEQSEQSPAQQQQHAQTEAQAEQHQLLQAEQKPQVQQQQQPSANSLEQLEQSLAEQQPQVQTEQQQLHGEQQQRPKAELQAEQQQAPQVEQQQQAQAELKAKEHLQPKSEPEAEQPKQPWVKLTAEQQLEQNAEPGIEQHQEPQTQQQQRSQADLQAEQQEQPQAEQQQQPQAEQEHTHFANPAQLPSVNQLAPPEVATCEASAISLGESLSKPHLEPEHESRKTHCSGAASNSHQQDCSAEGRVVNESAATCNSTSSAASRVSGDNSIGIYSRSHSSSFQDRSAAAVPSSQWPSPIESILVQQPSIQKRTNSTSDSADQGCLQQPFTDTCSNSPLVSAAQICLQQHSVDASANIPSDTAVNTSSLHSSTVGDRSGFADLRSESSAALAAVGVSSLQPNAADEMTSPANACSERLSDSATECNSTRRYGTTVATCADCVIASAANENVSSLQSCAENDMGSCADVQSMSRQNCAVEASSCISAAGQHSAAVNTHNVVEQPCNGQLPDEQAQLPDIPSAVVPCQHTSFQEPQVCQTATQQECSDQQLTTQHGRVQLNQCAAGSPMVPSSQCRGEAVQQTLHTVQVRMCHVP